MREKTEAGNLERELNAEISMIWRRVRQLERIAIGPDIDGSGLRRHGARPTGASASNCNCAGVVVTLVPETVLPFCDTNPATQNGGPTRRGPAL
jgi:hypothetical protein